MLEDFSLTSLIVFAVTIFVVAALAYASVSTKIKNRQMFARLLQAEMDKILVYAKFEELVKEKESKNIEQTDGFLKFISESREWAFNYIEETQSAIKSFDEKVGPIVKHYKESKKSLYRRQSELLSEITDAYDVLMQSMPAEENKTNNG
jgi:GTP-binding protein EngB required for normal cell division